MIKNPQTCWQYCIQTEHLREPKESWELLQYTIHNPSKSLKQCATDLNIDYNKATTWSMKYFYNQRRQAYTSDMNKSLTTAVTNYKLQQIREAEKRSKGENTVLNNELYFLQKDMSIKVELEKNKEVIPEYLETKVAKKEREYFNNSLLKSKKDKLIYDIATDPIPLEEIDEDLINETPAINSFLDAMRGNRDANHKD